MKSIIRIFLLLSLAVFGALGFITNCMLLYSKYSGSITLEGVGSDFGENIVFIAVCVLSICINILVIVAASKILSGSSHKYFLVRTICVLAVYFLFIGISW